MHDLGASDRLILLLLAQFREGLTLFQLIHYSNLSERTLRKILPKLQNCNLITTKKKTDNYPESTIFLYAPNAPILQFLQYQNYNTVDNFDSCTFFNHNDAAMNDECYEYNSLISNDFLNFEQKHLDMHNFYSHTEVVAGAGGFFINSSSSLNNLENKDLEKKTDRDTRARENLSTQELYNPTETLDLSSSNNRSKSFLNPNQFEGALRRLDAIFIETYGREWVGYFERHKEAVIKEFHKIFIRFELVIIKDLLDMLKNTPREAYRLANGCLYTPYHFRIGCLATMPKFYAILLERPFQDVFRGLLKFYEYKFFNRLTLEAIMDLCTQFQCEFIPPFETFVLDSNNA